MTAGIDREVSGVGVNRQDGARRKADSRIGALGNVLASNLCHRQIVILGIAVVVAGIFGVTPELFDTGSLILAIGLGLIVVLATITVIQRIRFVTSQDPNPDNDTASLFFRLAAPAPIPAPLSPVSVRDSYHPRLFVAAANHKIREWVTMWRSS